MINETFRLRKDKGGLVHIVLAVDTDMTEEIGNPIVPILDTNDLGAFTTPDGDGEEFDKMMKNLKERDEILILIKRSVKIC